MMRNRVIVHLSPNERVALQQMAEHDFRLPNEQIRLLIVNEAARRGILPNLTTNTRADNSTKRQRVSA